MPTPPAIPPTPATPLAKSAAAAILILAPILARAQSSVSPLPYWDLDPTIIPGSMSGVGPAVSIICDAMTIAGVGLALWVTRRDRVGLWWWVAAFLAFVGCEAVIDHGWLATYPTLGNQRIGAAWAAAILGGVGLSRLCRDPRLRIVVAAVLLGFLGPLMVKGIAQVTIEHQQTVDSFLRNKAATLSAMGWSEGSSMAKGYERRIMQTEASGWFGLSNVFASFVAAMLAAFTGMALAARLGRPNDPAATDDDTPRPGIKLPVACAMAALAGVIMAGSKGGAVVAVLGVAIVVAGFLVYKRASGVPRLIRLAGIAAPVAYCFTALLAIAARGAVGDRLNELSLLFRWFYLQAATRIAIAHPILGVGPDGFKDAYLLAKNPLSPEEIQSPHSVFFDWWACLGIFGIMWSIALCIWLTKAGRNAVTIPDRATPQPTFSPADEHAMPRLAVMLTLVASFPALYLQRNELVPIEAAVRVLSMVAWGGLSFAIVRRLTAAPLGHWRIGLTAAATVLAVQTQIELTASHVQSAGLFIAFVALAAAQANVQVQAGAPSPAGEDEFTFAPGRSFRRVPIAILAGMALSGSVGLIFFGARPALYWEASLARAAEAVRPLAEARQTLASLPESPNADVQRDLEQQAATLSKVLASTVAPNPRAISQAVERAAPILFRAAAAAFPYSEVGLLEWRTERERGRLLLLALIAEKRINRGFTDENPAWIDIIRGGPFPLNREKPGVPLPPFTGNQLNAAASWSIAIAESMPDSAADALAWRTLANDYLERARIRDPYNVDLALRHLQNIRASMQLLRTPALSAGPDQPEALAKQAGAIRTLVPRILQLNANMRYDQEVRGLTPEQLLIVEQSLREVGPRPPEAPPAPPTR